MSQATIAGGRRMSTARCYLDPVRQARQPAHRDRRADRGAPARRQALHRRALLASAAARARRAPAREVVVSAGTINSPQLLELSGIGQPERLRGLGIEVRHALPGVGENLRDHYAPRTRWAVGAKGITFNDTRPRARPRAPGAALRALPARACSAMRGGADPRLRLLARRAGGARPAARLGADADRARPDGPRIARQSGVTCYAHPMRPESKGHDPHHLGRSAPAAGHQLQLPVGAHRRRADRARDPHRPRRS